MKELINKYVWLVDTLTRYGRLTRPEINDLWQRSVHSDGNPIPERTFFYYRRGIEENFHIDIQCDSTGHYYIDEEVRTRNRGMTNWLLESFTVNTAMKETAIQTERVSVEDVPSAREFLPTVLSAISDSTKLVFTYAGFSKSRPETGIHFSPYFVKRYKQRWYMVGTRDKGEGLRTYALDRVTEMEPVAEHFEMPTCTPDEFFGDIVGVTAPKSDVKTVRIMTTPVQAKYFRALPFHRSQQETLHDNYSIFTYRLRLNYELVHELLGFGAAVKVLEPRELIIMMTDELNAARRLYDNPEAIPE